MKLNNNLLILIALSVLFFNSSAFADNASTEERIVPELKAFRINPFPPVIDGSLDDANWKNDELELARDFIQREPDEGKPATESTLVAVAYDDDALYFAFWCYDAEPDKIDHQLVRRDRWAESDVVTVRLDPYHDHQTGYRFDLSAAGVQSDCRLYKTTPGPIIPGTASGNRLLSFSRGAGQPKSAFPSIACVSQKRMNIHGA